MDKDTQNYKPEINPKTYEKINFLHEVIDEILFIEEYEKQIKENIKNGKINKTLW
jgi:hypothetical protein